MIGKWIHRILLTATFTASVLLAACGSSGVTPSRLVVFGDGLADTSYTVNDGTVNNWAVELAYRYGVTLTSVVRGGTYYAIGNARISQTPDAAGSIHPLTLTQQIDKFLASSKFNGNDDLVVVSAGMSDVVANMMALQNSKITKEQMMSNVTQAGADLATQVRRLVNNGAKYVVVTGSYDLSRSPWATAINQQQLLSIVSMRLNNTARSHLKDLGKNVVYIDAAYKINAFQGNPGGYGFTDGATPVCTSVDTGPGIGIGAGQVNSSLCTKSTLIAGADPNKYIFADMIYLTPKVHRQLGDYAYNTLRQRW